MSITTNEHGQQNIFAKEPAMYISDEDVVITHYQRSEQTNGRWAMVGIIAGIISYFSTGKLFFGIF